MIVDAHTHLWAPAHLGLPFTGEVRGPAGAEVDLTGDPDRHARGTADADAVLVFAFAARHIGVEVPNDYVADYVGRDPQRLIGYASVDPADPRASDELDRAHDELGLRGLKLPLTYQNCHPLDDRVMAVYGQAERLGLPVTLHMGTTPHPSAPLDYGRPGYVDEIARAFPELRIVIAHIAHPWEREALVVIRKHPHVYADVAAIMYRPYQLSHTLRLAMEYAVDGKLLLGSDFPWLTTAAAIAGLRRLTESSPEWGAQIPAEVIEGIVNRDALALLGL